MTVAALASVPILVRYRGHRFGGNGESGRVVAPAAVATVAVDVAPVPSLATAMSPVVAAVVPVPIVAGLNLDHGLDS